MSIPHNLQHPSHYSSLSAIDFLSDFGDEKVLKLCTSAKFINRSIQETLYSIFTWFQVRDGAESNSKECSGSVRLDLRQWDIQRVSQQLIMDLSEIRFLLLYLRFSS